MDAIQRDNQSDIWQINPQRAIHADRPLCIGILNITPDSFADGGELDSVQAAVDRAQAIVDEGGDGLDIGGESTRPGASRVSVDEQINRVVPVIEAIRKAGIDLMISVDTTRAAVASQALDAGADAINDVSAGSEDNAMLGLAADRQCGIVLMHRVSAPDQDQYSDQYQQRPIESGIVDHVIRELKARRDAAVDAGVNPACIMLDPGLGFGKDVEQNLALIRETDQLCALGHPVLSALSRKSFVGRVSLHRDSEPKERLAGTLGLSVVHYWLVSDSSASTMWRLIAKPLMLSGQP
ncbi:MAG: dihydropteroate synthase [Phycisphaerales bacterium]|nr:dihydropteroate synthase [Phycisphaerales bacterium]